MHKGESGDPEGAPRAHMGKSTSFCRCPVASTWIWRQWVSGPLRPREAPPHLLPRFRLSGLCLCSFLRLGRPSSPLYWVRSSSSPKCELLHQTVRLIRRREPTLPERAATWQSAHFCTMNVIQNQCLAQKMPEGALELGHSCPRGRGRQSDPPAPQGTISPPFLQLPNWGTPTLNEPLPRASPPRSGRA